jgi:hypothetical protein
MNDNAMKIVIALIAAAVIASPVACTIHGQIVLANAVKNGADPIAMQCALSVQPSTTVCIAKAMQPGIDPLAIRCAQRNSDSSTDPVCLSRGLQQPK